MADTINQKSLRQLFEGLPLRVRDWLTSEAVTYSIMDINKNLEAAGEQIKVIPRLILRLVVKDLKPESFITELSKGLYLPFSTAKLKTQVIEQRILRSIEAPLRVEAGVDIKLIYSGGAEEKPISPVLEVLKESSPTRPIPPSPPAGISFRPVKPPLIQTEAAAHPVKSYPPVTPTERASAGGTFNGTSPSAPPRPYVPPPSVQPKPSSPETTFKVPVNVQPSQVPGKDNQK